MDWHKETGLELIDYLFSASSMVLCQQTNEIIMEYKLKSLKQESLLLIIAGASVPLTNHVLADYEMCPYDTLTAVNITLTNMMHKGFVSCEKVHTDSTNGCKPNNLWSITEKGRRVLAELSQHKVDIMNNPIL